MINNIKQDLGKERDKKKKRSFGWTATKTAIELRNEELSIGPTFPEPP